MKYFLLIPLLFIILSCTNNDDSAQIEPTPNPVPSKENIYKFSNDYSILNQNFYKGPDGNEYPLEADVFFKKQWSFYNNPSIKTIELKNDSIIIVRENLYIEKYKFSKEGDNIIIEENAKKIVLGYMDQAKKSLSIYKNYKTYLIVLNKETNEIIQSKSSNYGKVIYDDFFPKIIPSPKKLTLNNEFIFWCNIEYVFIK